MKTRKIRGFAGWILWVLVFWQATYAAILTWDADPVNPGAQDGPGFWNTTTNLWWTGSANASWNSTIPDEAVFGTGTGPAGVITLSESITCGNITFNPAGMGHYVLAGGGFTLGLVNRTLSLAAHATIAAPIVGAGALTLANSAANAPSAVLTLSGLNTFTGGFNLGPNAPNTTGSVRAASDLAFGTGTIGLNPQGNQTSHRIELVGGVLLTNPITFYGRNNPSFGLVALSGSNVLAGPVNIAVGGQHYGFRSEASNGLQLVGALNLLTTGTRNFVFAGSGSGTLSGSVSGGATTHAMVKSGPGTWIFAGNLSFSGNVTLGEGTLTLDYTAQNSSKVPDAGTLTLAGGTLNLQGGSHVEVVASTIVAPGHTTLTRSSGSSLLRLNTLSRRPGGTLDFAAPGWADTDSGNTHGILGGYATVGGSDWAVNTTGGPDGPVGTFTGYVDLAARGSTLPDAPTAHVRFNSPGTGGAVTLVAATTTIQTLLQNTTMPVTIETANRVLRLGSVGGILVPAQRAGLTIGTAPDAGVVTAGGADHQAGELVFINRSTQPLVVNATIADNGSGPVSLTVSGTGTVSLLGNNAHTGTNYVSGGILNISSDANLGAVPAEARPTQIVISGGTLHADASFAIHPNRGIFLGSLGANGYNGGTISVAAGQTLSFQGVLAGGTVNAAAGFTMSTGPGRLTKTGPGILELTGANTYAGGTVIKEGKLRVSSAPNLGTLPSCYIPDHIVIDGGTLQAVASFTLGGPRGIMLGPVGSAGTGTIEVEDSQTLTLESRITDNWSGTGSLVKTGNGTLILSSGLNDYSGDTVIAAGTLQLNHPRALPNGPGKGQIRNQGVLALNNISPFLNRISGPGTIDHVGMNPITLTLGALDTDDTVGGGVHNSGGGPLTLVKAGMGTLTLGGTSSYSGATRILRGTLKLAPNASLTTTTNLAVATAATLDVSALSANTLTLANNQTLSGSGTVQGSIADSPGSVIAPGTDGPGTLTIQGNLTLAGGGTLLYDIAPNTLPGSGVNDLLIVTGTVNLTGATTLNLSYLQGVPAPAGRYTLLQYGNLIGDLNLLSVPQGFAVSNNPATRTIELVVLTEPVTLTWRGDGLLNTWDIGSSPNWVAGGTNRPFYAGDTVVFDDSGSNTPPIQIAGTVYPAAVIVNASRDYIFTGENLHAGRLHKSNTGNLVLANTNIFTQGALLQQGTIQIGNGGDSGWLAGGPVTNQGTLSFQRIDELMFTNLITGTGTIRQVGSGRTILTASNSYTGPTLLQGGILTPRHSAALGTETSGTMVEPGAQLFIDWNIHFTNESLTLAGTGPGNGALRKGGAGLTVWAGPVNLLGDTSIRVDGNATLQLIHPAGVLGTGTQLLLECDPGGQGLITGPVILGSGTLVKGGTGGTWTLLNPTNQFAPPVFINAGTLAIGIEAALGPIPSMRMPNFVTFAGGLLGVVTNAGKTNFMFADGRRGFTLAGNGGFNVGAGATLVISNEIAGAGDLTKTGPGTLVLSGSNSFSGILFLDTDSAVANDGITRITTSQALSGVPVQPGVPTLRLRNNNNGVSTLQLDGSQGSILILQDLLLACRNNSNAVLQNLAGSNVIAGRIHIQVGGADQWWQCDSGTLVLAGDVDYIGTLTGGRTYQFRGVGDFLVTGNINASPIGSPISIAKDGPGRLVLAGNNTYGTATILSNGWLILTGSISHTGTVTVVGGTFAGTGVVQAPMVIGPNGNLAPGVDGIGSLTIQSSLSLSGTTWIEIHKAAGIYDRITGLTTVAYGGILVVTNLAGSFALGDSFRIFEAGSPTGNFHTIIGSPGPGLAWQFNPATGRLTVVTAAPSTPAQLIHALAENRLILSWPDTHLGWILQVQTNSLEIGLSTNWVDVPASAGTNRMVLTIDPKSGTIFYRLRSP
ncbi:MAG: autotransporter-associated beta strand repeat-containing protein [Verrucomicrobiota bacterium]|nr:autotransporter-associated beta strand repeat-containing protein [Limisphaera sp.]MDW8381569.1 autotransporter-associated beta strand repeat-containing protein [Verrucomicrobiota bacterium]